MYRSAKSLVVAVAVGALSIAVAWAGSGLVPVRIDDAGDARAVSVSAQTTRAAQSDPGQQARVPQGARFPAGEFLVGVDKTPLTPAPGVYQPDGSPRTDPEQPAATWEKDPARCNIDEGSVTAPEPGPEGLFRDSALGWPGHNPDCIYMGGYGLGPVRAATGEDPELGTWVRSVAISNGEKTAILQVVDVVGYFHAYRPDVCDGCGLIDTRREIAERVGLPSEDFVSIASTHTHGGADLYGGWGGVPKWYHHQVRDAVITSAERAVANLLPARIAAGAIDARTFNNERRDTYHSTADYLAVWMQASTPGGSVTVYPDDPKCAVPGHAKKPECQPTEEEIPPSPLVTLVNHAAHPTTLGSGNTLLHPDWPGALNAALEDTFGGTALTFVGGLGNTAPSGGIENMGDTFARVLAADITRAGTQLDSNDIAAKSVILEHPITNAPEFGLVAIGAFDRAITPASEGGSGPGAYRWSKADDQRAARSCASSSPVTALTPVGAYRIGGLNIFAGPGELFSNLTEVVKSKARGGVQTMVFSQTNDALGYIMQSFEYDRTHTAATLAAGVSEYEELFALDPCFGDHVLDEMLRLAEELGVK